MFTLIVLLLAPTPSTL